MTVKTVPVTSCGGASRRVGVPETVVSLGVAVVTGVPSSSTETQMAVGSAAARGERSAGMAAARVARSAAVVKTNACILGRWNAFSQGCEGGREQLKPWGAQISSIGEIRGLRTSIRLRHIRLEVKGGREARRDSRQKDAGRKLMAGIRQGNLKVGVPESPGLGPNF